MASIQNLDLDSCNFTGALPANWSSMTLLTTLFLQNNRLNGVVPSSWGALSRLKTIDVSGNCIASDASALTAWIGSGSLQLFDATPRCLNVAHQKNTRIGNKTNAMRP
jgi:hypothetical protein